MKSRLPSAVVAAGFAAGLLATPSPSVLANGAGFFDDEDREVRGTIYFGSIKTDRGKSLEGATVRIKVQGADDEFVYKTGPFGRYKTDFVGLDVDPKIVEVTVTMAGYDLSTKDRRTKSLKPGIPVETNF